MYTHTCYDSFRVIYISSGTTCSFHRNIDFRNTAVIELVDSMKGTESECQKKTCQKIFFSLDGLVQPFRKSLMMFLHKTTAFYSNSTAAHCIFMTLEVNKIRNGMEAVEEMGVLLH